jgi:hypothetical protein
MVESGLATDRQATLGYPDWIEGKSAAQPIRWRNPPKKLTPTSNARGKVLNSGR